MVCVFGAFALGDLRVLKLFGVGMATAILVDATLVRMVLVPATMELLGGANWWMPRWLLRIVPTITVDTPTPGPVEVEPVLVRS
jgi:RND superfamily putative drug exporter